MDNFVPEGKYQVVRNELKEIICIIANCQGHLFPFVLKGKHVIRANASNRRIIKGNEIYGRLFAEVKNRFEGNEWTPKKALKVEVLHPLNWRYQKEKERLFVLNKYGRQILTNGMIKSSRKKEAKPFEDINAAIRGADHVIEFYAGGQKIGEIANISEIADLIAKTNDDLLNWATKSEEEREMIRIKVVLALEKLGKVRNEYKLIALDQLEKMQDIKDSLGRVNPSAMAARGALAEESAKKRKQQAKDIIAYSLAVRNVLINEKFEIENNLLSANIHLQAILNYPEDVWRQKNLVITEINEVLYFLQSAWANPYLRIAKNASLLLSEAIKNVRGGGNELAVANLESALAIIK